MLIKHKMPTRAINERLKDLTNQVQLMLSHIEELTPVGKGQKEHVREIKSAIRQVVRIVHKMHNLAEIEIDES